MPFGYGKPDSWLRNDDEFDRYNKPGSSDWFDLSDDVTYGKANNRHDAFKVESLLGYGGYFDLEKRGGPSGLSVWGLEEPIKKFQEKNGLKIDGLIRPGGPTIKKMKQLYGGVLGNTPAPTPAMVDAHIDVVEAGEDGFLYETGPSFEIKPNRRLDGKADQFEYERWNRDWARGSGHNAKSLAPEYESYIRQSDDEHGHDPGLIYARDLTRQVGNYYGKEQSSDLAKHLAVGLSDRPDLQREFLGGPVPTSPPIGTFKPGGLDRAKQWIDAARIAAGILPMFAKLAGQGSGTETAASDAAPAPEAPAGTTEVTSSLSASDTPPLDLFELAKGMQGMHGTPEDWALEQQSTQDEERARQAPQNQDHPKPAEWPDGQPPTPEDWALWYDPARPPAPLPPQDPADRARFRDTEANREIPSYWPNGQPPTGEEWGLHQGPPHAPDQPNPRPPRPGDGYPMEPDYRREPPPPRHAPGFADEMPHPAEGVGSSRRPPARVDAQNADELPFMEHEEWRHDRPILPETSDLSKLDDDAFEEVAAKAGADRNRLEEAIAAARERERHHNESFARVVTETGGTFGDDVVKDGLVGAAQQYALDMLKGKTPLDFSPETIAKRLGQGALMGLGKDAAIFVGRLAWHAVGEASARGRAEMNQDARGQHNRWEAEVRDERIARGRIRPDN